MTDGASTARFRNRDHAGRLLADRLVDTARWTDPLVLALPRGGVPVAVPVAARLAAELDVIIVRKVPAPGHTELAMGAVARVCGLTEVARHDEVVWRARVDRAAFDAAVAAEVAVLDDLAARYRPQRPAPTLTGRTVITVDDGMATGATMTAAVQLARSAGARQVVVAVPVGSAEACHDLEAVADMVVCLRIPRQFGAVSVHYRDFSPPSDEAVLAMLG